jgi:glycosyltransferase involved in cell wall biosynthesis
MEKRKMKIAFVCQPWDSFVPPVESGSIPIWTYEVIRRLKEQNCEFVVYSKQKKGLPKEEWREGILCRRVSIKLDMFSHKFIRHIPFVCSRNYPFYASMFYHPLYIRNIARDLQGQDCDVIHVMNFSQFVPILRAFNPDSKIVLNMRCDWLTQLPLAVGQQRLAKTDMMMGCSDYVTHDVQRAYPEKADRCQTVYNGVDVENFVGRRIRKKESDERCLLFVGRLSPEKGLHILLEAFAQVVKRYSKVHLNIVGPESMAPIDFIVNSDSDEKVRNLASFYSGSYLEHLKRQMSSEIASRVRFTGFIPHSGLNAYYDEADILINPSFIESFGRSLIEAMACGLPVIATKIGGMPEVVEEGRTGLLVESGDVSALTDAIVRLLEDEPLRLSMGQAGRERVEKYFSWDAVSANLLARYEEVMTSHV